MKQLVWTGLALALAVGMAAPALAGDEAVTLDGTVMCAKCARGETKECQDVLIVADGDGQGEYWIVKNEVSKGFGHACSSEKPARVTGSVSEKDGHKWITPSAMEAPAG